MKYSNIVTGLVAALLLSACGGGGGGGLDFSGVCFLCGPSQPPAPPATVFVVVGGPDQAVTEGDTVVLSGSADHSENARLSFSWSQSSGPGVAIVTQPCMFCARARFVAPPVTNATSLTFKLTATGSDGATKVASVTILVEPTTASALCLQAPLFTTSYAWTINGCTTDSADIAGDSRIATVYRQGEAEPNDSLQSANPLTFPMRIATERTATDVAGSVSGMANDNDDFFVFTPPDTGTYEVYLCNDPLVCVRGTITEKWFLSLSDQNFEVVAGTTDGFVREQVVSLELETGLPYYIGVHVWDADLPTWDYNLTILSESN